MTLTVDQRLDLFDAISGRYGFMTPDHVEEIFESHGWNVVQRGGTHLGMAVEWTFECPDSGEPICFSFGFAFAHCIFVFNIPPDRIAVTDNGDGTFVVGKLMIW